MLSHETTHFIRSLQGAMDRYQIQNDLEGRRAKKKQKRKATQKARRSNRG